MTEPRPSRPAQRNSNRWINACCNSSTPCRHSPRGFRCGDSTAPNSSPWSRRCWPPRPANPAVGRSPASAGSGPARDDTPMRGVRRIADSRPAWPIWNQVHPRCLLSSGHIAVEEKDTAQAQPAATAQPELDTGIVALMLLARYHQLPVDPAQIRHQYGRGQAAIDRADPASPPAAGLKSRLATVDMSRLGTTPLPAIAVMDNGDFVILARHDGDRVPIHPRSAGPEILSIQVFEASWSGRLILATSRYAPRARCRSSISAGSSRPS